MVHPADTGRANQFDEELVLEVTVKQEYSTARGKPWKIINESCKLMTDYIDWKRSSPYSIQEIHTIFGIEAAHDTLTKRLGLAAGDYVGKKHLKLVADFWPILEKFTAPMKHFMERGERAFVRALKACWRHLYLAKGLL
ncbi:hypothetical protein R1flu_002333 [Riccia fluitans]|uniref:Transposase n=1 Tax=Riccia fluitans TaxID=41844 RepID=A0ABD1Y632_9MARC